MSNYTSDEDLTYNVDIKFDAQETIKKADMVEKAIEEMAQSIRQAAEKASAALESSVPKAMNTLSSSIKGSSKRVTDAINGIGVKMANLEDAILKSKGTGEQKTRMLDQMQEAYKNLQRVLADQSSTEEELQKAQQDQEDTLKSLQISLKRINRVMGDRERTTQQAIKDEEALISARIAAKTSIAAQEKTMQTLEARLSRSTFTYQQKQKILEAVNSAHLNYTRTVSQFGRKSEEAADAKIHFNRVMSDSNKKLRTVGSTVARTDDVYGLFLKNNEQLTKTIILALGPLSGVASRVMALNSLLKANAFYVAAMFSSFTALTVGMSRTLSYGMEMEAQLMGLQGVLDYTGRSVNITTEELNELARTLAGDLIVGATEARGALMLLATQTNILEEDFREVIHMAQGMTTIMGGRLQSNTRRVARLLQDPARNLNVLAEQGIQFNAVQEEMIKNAWAVGNVHEAQAVVKKELAVFSELATRQADSLAGSIDGLGDTVQEFFEELSTSGTMMHTFRQSIDELTKSIQTLTENEYFIASLGAIFEKVASGIGKALTFVIDNINILSSVTIAYLVYSLTSRLIPAIVGVTAALWAKISAILSAKTATVTLTAATAGFGVALHAVMPYLIPVTIALGAAYLAYNNLTGTTERNIKTTRIATQEFGSLREMSDKLTEGMNSETRAILNNNRARYTSIAMRKAEMQVRIEEITQALQAEADGPWWRFWGDVDYDNIDELRAKLSALTYSYGLLQENMARLREEDEKHTAQLEGTNLTVGGAADTIQSLREKYQRAEMDANAFNKELGHLRTIIDNVRSGTVLSDEAMGYLAHRFGLSADQADELLSELHRLEAAMLASRNEAGKMDNTIQNLTRNYRTLLDQFYTAERDFAGKPLGMDMTDFRTFADLTQAQRNEFVASVNAMIRADERLSHMTLLDSSEPEEIAKAYRGVRDEMEALGVAGKLKVDDSVVKDIQNQYEKYREAILNSSTAAIEDRDALIAEANRREISALAEHASGMIEVEDDKFTRLAVGRDEHYNRLVDQTLNSLQEQYNLTNEMMDRIREEMSFDKGVDDPLENMMGSEVGASLVQRFSDNIHDPLIRAAEGFRLAFGDELESTNQRIATGFVSGLAIASTTMGELQGVYATLAQNSESAAKRYQQMAIAQATIAKGLAITQMWADPQMHTYTKMAMTGMIAGLLGAQIANIKNQGFASGGYVRGKGTGQSDSIPAMLSNGEYVVRAAAVNQLGVPALNAINRGEIPSFVRGGSVGGGGGSSIEIHNYSGAQIEQETGADEYGNERVRLMIKDIHRDNVSRGAHDNDVTSRFNVQRRGLFR